MSVSDEALDRRSLTLPDIKTALKKRIKRPKKQDYFWLLMCVMSGSYGVLHILQYRPRWVVYDLVLCGTYWKLHQYTNSKDMARYLRTWVFMVAFFASSLFWT